MTFKRGELRYGEAISDSLARRFGNYLVSTEYFDSDRAVTVKLDEDDDSKKYVVSLVMDLSQWDNDLESDVKLMALQFSEDLFDHANVEVQCCDSLMHVIRTFTYQSPGRKITIGKARLLYDASISDSLALAFRHALDSVDWFEGGKEKIMFVRCTNGRYEVHFVQQSADLDEATIQGMQFVMREWSREVFHNAPMAILFSDYLLHPFQRIDERTSVRSSASL